MRSHTYFFHCGRPSRVNIHDYQTTSNTTKSTTSPSRQLCADLKYFAAAAYRFLRGSGRVSHITFRASKNNYWQTLPPYYQICSIGCHNNNNAIIITNYINNFRLAWLFRCCTTFRFASLWMNLVAQLYWPIYFSLFIKSWLAGRSTRPDS